MVHSDKIMTSKHFENKMYNIATLSKTIFICVLMIISTIMSLKVTSYNCQSVNTNIGIIQSLCLASDVILLQETLLNENNHAILGNINANFDYAYTPATRKPGVFVGRSSGGLAVLWRKSENIKFSPVYFTERIIGIYIIYNYYTYLILNVYFICDYGDTESLIEYKSTIANCYNIIEN